MPGMADYQHLNPLRCLLKRVLLLPPVPFQLFQDRSTCLEHSFSPIQACQSFSKTDFSSKDRLLLFCSSCSRKKKKVLEMRGVTENALGD
jgi:hypothetical protein